VSTSTLALSLASGNENLEQRSPARKTSQDTRRIVAVTLRRAFAAYFKTIGQAQARATPQAANQDTGDKAERRDSNTRPPA
jgi:hypothetical protein